MRRCSLQFSRDFLVFSSSHDMYMSGDNLTELLQKYWNSEHKNIYFFCVAVLHEMFAILQVSLAWVQLKTVPHFRVNIFPDHPILYFLVLSQGTHQCSFEIASQCHRSVQSGPSISLQLATSFYKSLCKSQQNPQKVVQNSFFFFKVAMIWGAPMWTVPLLAMRCDLCDFWTVKSLYKVWTST